MYMVAVDAGKCSGCEECVSVCPQGVFQMSNNVSDPHQAAECIFCESCLGVCPATAITIKGV